MRGHPNVPENRLETEFLSDTGAETIRQLLSNGGEPVASHLTAKLATTDKTGERVAAPPILTVLRGRLLQAVGVGIGLILHDPYQRGVVILPITTIYRPLSID